MYRHTSMMNAAALTVMISAPLFAQEAKKSVAPETLPLDQIEWVTNMDEPLIGSPDALRGGTLRVATPSYPDTFRRVGPNSNGLFANWNRPFSMNLDGSLTMRHPDTDAFVPLLATHWAVDSANHSVYYKLDERAKWNDGESVTADDYVYAYEFYTDTRIADPGVNSMVPLMLNRVEKLDDYTIRVVGQKPSWRPLSDFDISPVPKHVTDLDKYENWPEQTNYDVPVTPGPYIIHEWKTNEWVTFKRVANWWGDDHRYMTGLFNPEFITLRVIQDRDRQVDFFLRGDLDYHEIYTARTWETEMDFPELEKGWVHARKVFTESPEGMSGVGLNTSSGILKNKDFRKALQYLFNFEAINSELMFNAYYQKVSAFHGTPYANPDLEPYGFDPRKAREHLRKAGFIKRGSDGYLVNEQGERAEITLSYGTKGLEQHLTVLQNFYKRGGIDLKLQLLEPAAAFRLQREKATEMFFVGMTGGFYPDPRQYFHSEFSGVEQTNNFWNFGNEETDRLIEHYEFNMDEETRLIAMHKLDEIIQDEAFYIPGWFGPYIRFMYWDYVEFPENFYPRRASNITEWTTLWINPEKKKALEAAKAADQTLDGPKGVIDIDTYGILEKIKKTTEK